MHDVSFLLCNASASRNKVTDYLKQMLYKEYYICVGICKEVN